MSPAQQTLLVISGIVVLIPTPDSSTKQFQENKMSHWLHCNRCLSPPVTNLKFYLTNCSHIFCEKCVMECTKEKCKVCGSICKTMLLNNKVSQEIESLFHEPMEVFKRSMKKVEQNLEFQKNHQKRLFKQMRARLKAMESQLAAYHNAYAQSQVKDRELIRLKSENEYLKLLLSKKDSHTRCKNGISPRNFDVSPTTMPHDMTQHCAHSSLNKPLSSFSYRTPPQAVIHSATCSPIEFGTTVYPMSIPRPIAFPKSG
ncbi:RING finger protein 212B-like isoform X2 [Biomphalaria glabrata]|uniref:RING finger protein 212B-like isoform X2 n=1 Tax=Biomphalaria glabrata TaxID=6526 RepID=A0A9U8E993_BIOGL|nr:RING finger protein 212B-like isoform X2 [Biomphalaria glabrata]